MKHKITIIVAALLGMVLGAQAQIGGLLTTAVLSGETNVAVVPGSAIWTNSINSVLGYTNMTPIDCRGKEAVWLQFRGIPSAAGVAGVKIWLFKGVDTVGAGGSNPADAATYMDVVEPLLQGGVPWTAPTPNATAAGLQGCAMTNFSINAGTLPPVIYVGIISNNVTGANWTNYSVRAYAK